MTEPDFFLLLGLLGSVDMQVHHHSHVTQQSRLTIISPTFPVSLV